jgi:hypothetical protein
MSIVATHEILMGFNPASLSLFLDSPYTASTALGRTRQKEPLTMSADLFIGAWRLLSLEARTSTGDLSYPFGKDAAGYLLYTREGYMSASIMQAHRAHFASPDALQASTEEKLAAFDTYSSYSGRYEVRGQTVIHHVEVSSFPNWTGKAQERLFAFSADRLTLSAPPMRIGGVEQNLVAIWQRLPSHAA